MTCSDRLSPPAHRGSRRAAIVRSDYRRAVALPGPLCLPSAFPFVGRVHELDALRALLPSGADDGRRVVLIGGEAGSGKSRLVREFATEADLQRRAGALRRLRRGRARALRRVRGGARPARPRRRARRRSAPRSGRPAASSRACSRTSRCGRANRPTPTRTRSATACTPRSPTCSPASATSGRSCSCSRTPTGPTGRRSACCATWPAAAPARACCCWRPSATPTCPTRWARRWPTCAAPRTSCGSSWPG